MAGGIAGVGGGSGIDTETIINSIIEQRNRRITRIEDRISKAEEEKRAFLDVNSRLLSMQETARRLMNGTSFNSSIVRSSKSDVLLATGNTSALQGTFQFYTKSLASVAQYVSNGLPDASVSRVTSVPGELTIEVGDSSVVRATDLDALNGGTGVDRGKIRITDDAGRTAVVDLSFAVSVNDVIDAINNNGVAQVTARVNDLPGTGLMGDGLIVENISGGGNLSISNVGLGKTATTLGIEATDLGGTVIGTRINTVGRNTQISQLNDGRGAGNASATTTMISITDSSGTYSINLSSARTLGEVIDIVNGGPNTAKLSISSDGKGLVLTDSVTPSPTLDIIDVSNPGFLRDLGLDWAGGAGSIAVRDTAAGTISGGGLVTAINSVRMASLGGVSGTGFMAATAAAPHSFEIYDTMGSATTVFLNGSESLSDVVNQINNRMGPGASVLARVDSSGTGIEIIDQAGGPGTLTITDAVGTAAASLGLVGTHPTGKAMAGNLNFRHMHANRLLSDFGLDEGFVSGRIEIVDRNGGVNQVDVSNVRTLGELVNKLNATAGVSASINSTGDGILFTDNTAGSGAMVIRDVSGTIARKMGLSGTFVGTGLVNRRMEYTVEVTEGDTLNDLVAKIQGLNVPVIASIVNDGTAGSGFRLSVTGKAPGAKNAVSVRSDLASLNFSQTSNATDAVMLYGNAEGTGDPVVVRSATNTFKGVLAGVTLDLLSVSNSPVTVSVTKDLQAASNDITDLFDSYNSLADRIDELAGYDSEKEEGGPLLGNGTIQRLEFQVVAALIDPVDGLPLGANTLAGFGIIRKTDGTFDVNQETLLRSLETRIDELRDLFGNQATLDPNTQFKNWNGGAGLKTGSGADLKITFADGSADLDVDLDSFDRLEQLLNLLNNDGRVLAEISPTGRSIRIRDLTTPNGTNGFSITSANAAGAASALGFSRTAPLPGSRVLETKAISLNTNLGIGRKLDGVLTAFTSSDGLIQDQTGQLDERIKRFNTDIDKMAERIDAERARLERRFAAMEAALAESQQASNTLSQQVAAQNAKK